MSDHLHFCRWQNPEGRVCYRPTPPGAGLCRWHRAADRVAQCLSLDGRLLFDENNHLKLNFWIVLFVLCSQFNFMASALNHFRWLHSGAMAGKLVGHDPRFPIVFLGISLILTAKSISMFRGHATPKFFDRSPTLWSGLMWALAAVLLAGANLVAGQEFLLDRFLLAALALATLPLLLRAHRSERRTGICSPLAVLAGLGCILLAGLCGVGLELLHRISGRYDYIDSITTNASQNKILHSNILMESLAYSTFAIDAAVALFFTGSVLTPFGPRMNPLRWYVELLNHRSKYFTDFFISFIFVVAMALSMAFSILGQALMLHWLMWMLLSRFGLNQIPFIYIINIIIVVSIHSFVSRRVRDDEPPSPDPLDADWLLGAGGGDVAEQVAPDPDQPRPESDPHALALVVEARLVEDCLREDLSLLERARAVRTLVDRNRWTVAELAEHLAPLMEREVVGQLGEQPRHSYAGGEAVQARHGRSGEYLAAVHDLCSGLGDSALEAGEFELALRHSDIALELTRNLRHDFPDDARFARQLAMDWKTLGVARNAAGAPLQAYDCLRNCLEVLEEMRRADMELDPELTQVEEDCRLLMSTVGGDGVLRLRRAMGPSRVDWGGMSVIPHPLADADRAAELNIAYQKELARWREEVASWKALPLWTRWRVERPRAPEAPSGI